MAFTHVASADSDTFSPVTGRVRLTRSAPLTLGFDAGVIGAGMWLLIFMRAPGEGLVSPFRIETQPSWRTIITPVGPGRARALVPARKRRFDLRFGDPVRRS